MYYISPITSTFGTYYYISLWFCFPLAQKLWYNWEYQELPYLWQFIIWNEDAKADNIKKPELNLEYPLELNIKIPVWNRRIFKIVEAISHLQKKMIVYFFEYMKLKENNVCRSWNYAELRCRKAMTWWYDKEGFFPVTVKTQWERFLKDFRLKNWRLRNGRKWYGYLYKSIRMIKTIFLTFDNSINLDNWIIEE